MHDDSMRIVLTCEHGGCRVPTRYRSLFAGRESVLTSHRGYDPGALSLLRHLARETEAPCYVQTVTRLLVDANRSERNPAVFSEFTRGLPAEERELILERYHRPYRERVAAAVEEMIERDMKVLHLSVHSFTPELKGCVRNAEIGLLYDPARRPELDFCRFWKIALRGAVPHWRVRVNYPYKGISDGLTAALRQRFAESQYLGIELEVNQALVFASRGAWRRTREHIAASLREVWRS